jgi:iron(II)-dependent oxidoreductase
MASGAATRSSEQAAALESSRTRTLALVEGLGDADLARVVDPLLSPLLWDLGHIANFEQRWLLGSDDDSFDVIYNPFAQPRARRGELPVLHSAECFGYMGEVREHVNERFDDLDPKLVELVIQHEQQHNETMLQLLRQLDGYRPPERLVSEFRPPTPGSQRIKLREAASRAYRPLRSRDWIEFPEGEYVIGSAPGKSHELIYDNELSEHAVHLDPFSIATRPVTNGEFIEWMELGGYEKDEWWSPEGRAWLAETPARAPLGWRRVGSDWVVSGFGDDELVDESAPVCHINWFEADAFARSHGARLPTEFEWEAAASYDPRNGATGPRRLHAWGDHDWSAGAANLDHLAFGVLPTGTADHGYAPIDMNGQVWEWTSSEFSAYPGFEPFAYEEYSKPFFDNGYRVLRGGSWATSARTVSNRFRNWDLPQRRQIFSGMRMARSL